MEIAVRLHEYEAKQLLAAAGVEVPAGAVAADAAAARAQAARLGGRGVIKAQVLAGGRGRDGGVQLVADADTAAQWAARILARPCRGELPELVLVEAALDIVREHYAAVTIDPTLGCPVLLLGQGGVDVEDRAHAGGAPRRRAVDPLSGPTTRDLDALTVEAGLQDAAAAAMGAVLMRLWTVFDEQQALTVEINPVAELADGRLVAADAVIELDDAALEAAGRDAAARDGGPAGRRERTGGMTFVPLGGEVGLVCSGAGLGMATVDLIAEHATPANFLETGGGISRELMRAAMERVLACPGVRGVLINVYGGINPIHEGALGVADVMAAGCSVPVVAKALGNHEEETWQILEAAGVTVVREAATEAAVRVLLERMAAASAAAS